MNANKKLQSILPVPASPIETDKNVLKDNVSRLNTTFPADYIEFSRVYGSGQVKMGPYSWEVWSAFRPSYPKIAQRFFEIWNEFRESTEAFDVPLGLFPEKGGLLPFGVRDDVWFTWKTEGQPDEWPIVVMWSYEVGGYQRFEMNFSTFLVKLLDREIQASGFKSVWDPKNDITFIPKVYYSAA